MATRACAIKWRNLFRGDGWNPDLAAFTRLPGGEAGRLALISKHGHPLFVAVPLDEHLLESGVTVALACRLFAERVLSLGKAARLAGLSPQSFIEHLGAMGIPAVDYDPAELDGELARLGV